MWRAEVTHDNDRHCEFRTRIRPTLMDETSDICRPPTVMTGLVPRRLSIWAACKANHVDGRDKPWDEILWGRPRDLISCGCRPHGMERSDD